MKRVLVTGGSGFVGRNSIRPLLESGYDIHLCLPHGQSEQVIDCTDLMIHRCDLLDHFQTADLVKKVRPSHLLHFAWYAEHGEFWSHPDNVRWVQAGIELVRSFATYGGQRITCVGSCAEYDWAHGFCSETVTPLNPQTLYGECKNCLLYTSDAADE